MYLAVVFSLLTSTRQAVFKLMGQSGGNVNFMQKKVICLGHDKTRHVHVTGRVAAPPACNLKDYLQSILPSLDFPVSFMAKNCPLASLKY